MLRRDTPIMGTKTLKAVLICLSLCPPCFSVSSVFQLAWAQPLPYQANAKHLGVVNCANSLCHGSITKWKDSPVLQNEYVTWSRVDKHATKAYQVLFEERSRRI